MKNFDNLDETLNNLFNEEGSTNKYIEQYVIKCNLYRPKITDWKEGETLLSHKIEELFNSAIKWFNNVKFERQLEVLRLNKDTTEIFFLLKCTKKNNKKEVINKFGAFAKKLYNDYEFNNIVNDEDLKQNRLFELSIIKVDDKLNFIEKIV